MAEQKSTRNLVLDILLLLERENLLLGEAQKRVFEQNPDLDRRDRAFIRRLSVGTIERMLELDYIINWFSKTKTEKMKPVIRAILRSGVYQLKYMDSVPASAACSEAVKLAVRRGFSGLKGFVNGVMRQTAAHLDEVEFPVPQEDLTAALSVRYSMPGWLVGRFLSRYGREGSERIFSAFFAQRGMSMRVDTGRMTREAVLASLSAQGIRAKADLRLPCAIEIQSADSPVAIPEFQEGLLYVQDISSMLAADLAGAKPGDFVLDICAAPGGKSTYAAQTMQGTGLVVARDQNAYKVGLLQENIVRCGLSNMRAEVYDACRFDPDMENRADIVIADLPCSGLGVIGSKPDIKYHASPERIRSLAVLQKEMLFWAGRYVKPGGTLVYSTCTLTPEENEENIAWFLREFPAFSLVCEREILPDGSCDGFYMAKLRRLT